MNPLSLELWYTMTEAQRLRSAEVRLGVLQMIEEGKHPLSFTQRQGKLAEIKRELELELYSIFDYERSL